MKPALRRGVLNEVKDFSCNCNEKKKGFDESCSVNRLKGSTLVREEKETERSFVGIRRELIQPGKKKKNKEKKQHERNEEHCLQSQKHNKQKD